MYYYTVIVIIYPSTQLIITLVNTLNVLTSVISCVDGYVIIINYISLAFCHTLPCKVLNMQKEMYT